MEAAAIFAKLGALVCDLTSATVLSDMTVSELLPMLRQMDRAVRVRAQADHDAAVAYSLLSDLRIEGDL